MECTLSLALLFITFNIANLFSAPVVEFLHAKWAILTGGILVVLFHVGFFFLNRIYLYGSSLFLGLASSCTQLHADFPVLVASLPIAPTPLCFEISYFRP